jgi:hypothetical protein
MGPKAERKRWACLADLNRRIFFSRSRVGWCEFSARLFNTRVLAMLHARQDLTFGRTIALQFIGDDHTWHVLELFEKLTEKAFGGFFVASALDEDSQHIAVLIHGSPKILPLPTNGEVHLVQMPFVATARTTATQFIGVGLPKLQTPLSNGFIGHDNPPLCVVRSSTGPKTEREAERQPNSMADDFRRETVASLIGSNGGCFHEAILTQCSATFLS